MSNADRNPNVILCGGPADGTKMETTARTVRVPDENPFAKDDRGLSHVEYERSGVQGQNGAELMFLCEDDAPKEGGAQA